MSGLREKKKEDRNIRIQDSAIKLFSSVGYENTTMSKIAKEANLGVGTLYNYYKSKEELLMSIVNNRAGHFIVKFDKVIEDFASDIEGSIMEFFKIYLESFSFYGKRIWREFLATALIKQPSVIEYIWQTDEVFMEALGRLFKCMKDRNLVDGNVNIDVLVSILYGVLMSQILRYLASDDMTIEQIQDCLRVQTGVIIKGTILTN